MIVFDLRCSGDHVFEVWFASSGAFAEQQERGLVTCPVCGDHDVAKAVMAPRVGAKGNARTMPTAADVKAMLQMVAGAQAEVLKSSRWVGKGFAAQARAMHDGERDHEVIHGQATSDEAKALIDDGVAVMPLLVPVAPPETLN